MLTNALLFLLNTVLDLLTLAFLLRFYFQLTKVSFQNQAAQMIVVLTNFAVKPMRRIMLTLGNLGLPKLDIATLLLAYLTQLLLAITTLWLSSHVVSNAWLTWLAIALVSTIILSITLFLYAILIQAILSWINPHTANAPLLATFTKPILDFVRKLVPMVSGKIDFSPLVFMIAAQLLLTTLLVPLKNSLLHAVS